MKNIILTSLFSLVLLSMIQAEEKPVMLATASMIADIAQNVVGEHIEIKCIVPIGGDPHLYEPKPSDARLIGQADAVLMNGLTFEGWLDDLIENAGTKAQVITVSEGSEIIKSEDFKNATDPHAWMNALNGIVYAENIKKAAIRLLPEQAEAFEINFKTTSKLWRHWIKKSKKKSILFRKDKEYYSPLMTPSNTSERSTDLNWSLFKVSPLRQNLQPRI